ncbi:carbamoyltransferase family protein [Paracoccus saliphilus]|uniref:Carbamoyltransferase n=1 Tax=Paracoccus saliphilus TaxID=405559 RepID=A0AA45W7A8_9RHOB|nr:carbamoyltransferase C-terminal domain-containing protein [Paracoccus saliphilus]WCR03124.1 hypothetical protein JHX88_20475 [Paracoccus saliphilus]SIT08027.1 carbamoyltransferase [Paracoccus saliphilus]
MSYTLGLATMDNSAAALFQGNRLVAAIEEERLSRIKNDGSFPHLAISEVLDIAGIRLSNVDTIAVYWKPWQLDTRVSGTLRKLATAPLARAAILARLQDMAGTGPARNDPPPGSWRDLFRLRKILTKHHGPTSAHLHFIDHHHSHQLYGEAMRDWNGCLSLSYDGGGERNSTVLTAVRDGRRQVVTCHRWPNSLGHYYATFTGYLGFKMLEGEYKLMGLAPYGKPRWRDTILTEVLQLEPEGRYRLNTTICDYHAALQGRFHPRLKELFGPPRAPDAPLTEEHIDLATSLQAAFEAVQTHVLSYGKKRHPDLRRLVISGGSALNVTANGRLLQAGMFDEIIIPPAPHDAGCAVGAALAVLPDAEKPSVRSPYQGRDYSAAEIATAIAAHCRTPPPPLPEHQLIETTAQMLTEGRLIAWFQGRAEFGPRALGARSFLADPRRDEIREKLNDKIKKRELFRPFAPSVTEDGAPSLFALDQPSPYMNIVADVIGTSIPAVTHVDGTARVHTVSRDAHARYHALIARFGELTGVPALLNTSFNIQEPIVYSPEHALRTFAASGVDALVIGDHVLTREDLVCP